MLLGNVIEFPDLERLYLYRINSKMARAPERDFEDHHEYLIIWQRHMPKLREVAFTSDVVWTRHANGTKKFCSWLRTNTPPMKGVPTIISDISYMSSGHSEAIWSIDVDP